MDHAGLLQREFGSRLFNIGAFLNLVERMNYGKYNIFIYSLMMFFSFQTVLDQTTDLKVMSVRDRKVTHLFCIHL